MMLQDIPGFVPGFARTRRMRGATAAAVMLVFLPAVSLAAGGCAGAPEYTLYQAEHTSPEDYNAAGSGNSRPLAMTGQVMVSADPLWKQYVARTQAFVNYGRSAGAPLTGGASEIAAGAGGAGKSAPARTSGKTAGKTGVKKIGKKAGKSAKPQAPAGSGGLFPEPVCPEGCIPAPGYRRAAQTQARSPAPGTQPAAPAAVPTPSAAQPAVPAPPAAPVRSDGNTVPPVQAPANAPAPADARMLPEAQPTMPVPVQNSGGVAPASSSQPPESVPDGGRLLPPVNKTQAAPDRDPALAPPGGSDLGYAPAPPPS
jgi:hypothetical protein